MVYSRTILRFWFYICTLRRSVGEKTTLISVRNAKRKFAATNCEKMEAMSRANHQPVQAVHLESFNDFKRLVREWFTG